MAEDFDTEAEAHATGPFVWGRQRVVMALLLGAGSVALGWVSWLLPSATDRRSYKVVAQWRIPGGGKGLILAVGTDPSHEDLRLVGERLKEKFGHLDHAVVMVFDDAEAAHLVRQGSRIIGEEKFRSALLHQRAMYLRSSARGVHTLTIYEIYPEPREIINYFDFATPKK